MSSSAAGARPARLSCELRSYSNTTNNSNNNYTTNNNDTTFTTTTTTTAAATTTNDNDKAGAEVWAWPASPTRERME